MADSDLIVASKSILVRNVRSDLLQKLVTALGTGIFISVLLRRQLGPYATPVSRSSCGKKIGMVLSSVLGTE